MGTIKQPAVVPDRTLTMSRIQGVLKGKATDEPLSSLSNPKFIKTSLSFKFTFSPS